MIPYETSTEPVIEIEQDHPELLIESSTSPSYEAFTFMKQIKLLTWNTFSIPFANPKFLLNPSKCCKWLETTFNRNGILFNNNDNDHQLIIFCFQELWAFKIGIAPKFIFNILKYFEYIPILGYLLTHSILIISALIAFIISLFINITHVYDAKDYVINHFKFYLQHSIKFPYVPWNKFMDNGLLILTNHSPSKSGYERYKYAKMDDALASKGFIWCYFDETALLIINTHLQAAGNIDCRLKQLDQLKTFIDNFKEDLKVIRDVKVLIAGDFNIDMKEYKDPELQDIEMQLQQNQGDDVLLVNTNNVHIGDYLSLRKISNFECTHSQINIDHVFTDLEINGSAECNVYETETSDHRLLFMNINIV